VFAAIRRHRPGVVLTFGPGGIAGCADCIAAHRAATAGFDRVRAEHLGLAELYAVLRCRAAGIGGRARVHDLPNGRPNTRIDVSETHAVKLEALRLHASQVADARDRVARLEKDPETVAMLYRAWPTVGSGDTTIGFLQP
jgi:LmbE family N-acetylglucosaminyl deacetylase